jgi:hypothetical protein
VTLHPGDDGMSTLGVSLPTPVSRAVYDVLEQYAAAAVEGDERTKAQRMVDCLVDLVLRPGEHGLAPVQAQLTVVATVRTLLGGDEPGEVDGDLVPAEMVRELAYALGLLPRPEATSGGGVGPPTDSTPTPDPGLAGLLGIRRGAACRRGARRTTGVTGLPPGLRPRPLRPATGPSLPVPRMPHPRGPL